VREGVVVKSPVREYCTPGSVRGSPGNRRPYLYPAESAGHVFAAPGRDYGSW
jgi:hypothetical protein